MKQRDMTKLEQDTELEELKALLRIDEENLAKEWAEQPIRYVQAVRVCARAEATVSYLSLERDILEATIHRTLRSTGVEGVGRVTDAAIKAAIRVDERTVAADDKVVEATHYLSLVRGVVRAYEQRERSLKYIQMSQALPMDSETRTLGRNARRMALSRYADLE